MLQDPSPSPCFLNSSPYFTHRLPHARSLLGQADGTKWWATSV